MWKVASSQEMFIDLIPEIASIHVVTDEPVSPLPSGDIARYYSIWNVSLWIWNIIALRSSVYFSNKNKQTFKQSFHKFIELGYYAA